MIAGLTIALALVSYLFVRLALVLRDSRRSNVLSDPLTGLPNRLGFEDVLARRIARGDSFAVLWLNLGGLRETNELHGYRAGDAVLVRNARTLRASLRQGEIAARLAGGEFLVSLRGPSAAARILAACPCAAQGVSLYPDDAATPAELIRRAVAAGARRDNVVSMIESALRNDRLRLVYQPIVGRTGAIVCMEAYVRIDDAALGVIAPAKFISIAEETGLIHEIGRCILRRACQQARDWRDAKVAVPIALNVSPVQLQAEDFKAGMYREMRAAGLSAESVVLHVSGGSRIGNAIQADPDGEHLSRTVENAHRQGLPVIAEGIEEQHQYDQAFNAGCDLFQGYYVAPPLEPADATRMLTGLTVALAAFNA